jgi:hypothetical protein
VKEPFRQSRRYPDEQTRRNSRSRKRTGGITIPPSIFPIGGGMISGPFLGRISLRPAAYSAACHLCHLVESEECFMVPPFYL